VGPPIGWTMERMPREKVMFSRDMLLLSGRFSSHFLSSWYRAEGSHELFAELIVSPFTDLELVVLRGVLALSRRTTSFQHFLCLCWVLVLSMPAALRRHICTYGGVVVWRKQPSVCWVVPRRAHRASVRACTRAWSSASCTRLSLAWDGKETCERDSYCLWREAIQHWCLATWNVAVPPPPTTPHFSTNSCVALGPQSVAACSTTSTSSARKFLVWVEESERQFDDWYLRSSRRPGSVLSLSCAMNWTSCTRMLTAPGVKLPLEATHSLKAVTGRSWTSHVSLRLELCAIQSRQRSLLRIQPWIAWAKPIRAG